MQRPAAPAPAVAPLRPAGGGSAAPLVAALVDALFPAFRYAFAYLVVISTLDAIDSSLLMAQQRHRYAGIPI